MKGRAAGIALLASALAGCSTFGTITGAVAGIATGTATTNPAVAIGVAIGVKAAADQVGRSVGRRMKQAEQDAIASVASELREGDSRPWEVKQRLPWGHARGEVRVTRVIATPLTQCKEVLFSVDEGEGDDRKVARSWFAASVCQQADRWKWAAAEPAVERWGTLQ